MECGSQHSNKTADLTTQQPCFNSHKEHWFFSSAKRSVLGPKQPPNWRALVALPRGKVSYSWNWPQVRDEWICTSAPKHAPVVYTEIICTYFSFVTGNNRVYMTVCYACAEDVIIRRLQNRLKIRRAAGSGYTVTNLKSWCRPHCSYSDKYCRLFC